jgi:hypothetical protein
MRPGKRAAAASSGRPAGQVDRHGDAAPIEQLDRAIQAAWSEVRVHVDDAAIGRARDVLGAIRLAVLPAAGGAQKQRSG